MSYSAAATRRRLPLYYLAVPFAAGVIWLYPRPDLLLGTRAWLLLPLWIALGHLLCAAAYVLTSGRLRRGLGLLRSSLLVYGPHASLTHMQAASLVAVAEEALFRYLLLGWLSQRLGSPWAALGIVTAAFVLAHLPAQLRRGWRPAAIRHVADLTLFGAVLGLLVIFTGSIHPAWIVHTTRNYTLRCLLVSRAEYDALHGAAGPRG